MGTVRAGARSRRALATSAGPRVHDYVALTPRGGRAVRAQACEGLGFCGL